MNRYFAIALTCLLFSGLGNSARAELIVSPSSMDALFAFLKSGTGGPKYPTFPTFPTFPTDPTDSTDPTDLTNPTDPANPGPDNTPGPAYVDVSVPLDDIVQENIGGIGPTGPSGGTLSLVPQVSGPGPTATGPIALFPGACVPGSSSSEGICSTNDPAASEAPLPGTLLLLGAALGLLGLRRSGA